MMRAGTVFALPLALMACVPTDVVVSEGAPAEAAAAPPPPPVVAGGIPVTALLDCSVGGIGLFGNCEAAAQQLCAEAGLPLATLEEIDPENPQVIGIATNQPSVVEAGIQPASHRVTCA